MGDTVLERLRAVFEREGRRPPMRAFVTRHYAVLMRLLGDEDRMSYADLAEVLAKDGVRMRGGDVPTASGLRQALSKERKRREKRAAAKGVVPVPPAGGAVPERRARSSGVRTDEEVQAELLGIKAHLLERGR